MVKVWVLEFKRLGLKSWLFYKGSVTPGKLVGLNLRGVIAKITQNTVARR